MTEEKIKALVAKLRKLVPARGEWTTLAEAACGDAADALEGMLVKSAMTEEQKFMALQDRALELTVEYAPKHEYRDPDSGNACFSALGFARDIVKALEDETVEVWHRDRKVVIYADSVLRVWGPNIETEMSNAPRSLQAVQDAMDWLYAEPPEGKCRECSNTGYVADGNHCMACSVPADPGIEELFQRQQAGFERCYEALGITDDRERSWSALVLAVGDIVALEKSSAAAYAKLQRDYMALKELCSRSETAAAEAQVKLKNIAALEDTLREMSEEKAVNFARLCIEGFHDALRIAKKSVGAHGDLLDEKMEHMQQERYKAIDHYWKVYQAGRGSADHTDKEAFAQTLQLFAECTKGS